MTPIHAKPLYRASRVSPDGRFAAFQSFGNPTGYDNVDPADGKRYSEVYRYDAVAEELLCVSCNPSGARPSGEPHHARPTTLWKAPHGQVDGEEVGDQFGANALLPTWERELYPSRALLADGSRVYFHSYEALAPRDTNGMRDVYQWEAPGAGSCEVGGRDYVAQNGGCVSLISTGVSPQHSEFLDASADGRDVFITTTSNLHPGDEGLIDVYDARVGGGFPFPAQAAGCEGEACQSPPAPPDDPTPASAAYQGPGNVKEPPAKPRCRKGKLRKRGRCVKRKNRGARHGKRSDRANHDRGSHR